MAATQPVSRSRRVSRSTPGPAQVPTQPGLLLTPDDRIADMKGYRALVNRVVGVFGDEIKASRWLSLPNRDLNGKTPIQVVQDHGYDLVPLEPILIRIEHGIDYDSGAA